MLDQMYGCFSYKLSPNLSDYLRASLDRRKEVAAVAIDLNKAFDSVCHACAGGNSAIRPKLWSLAPYLTSTILRWITV